MMRPIALLAAFAAGALPPARAARAQRLEVSLRPARVTVGDPVTLELRAALPAGTTVLAVAPGWREALPEGVRLIAIEPPRPAPRGAGPGTLVLARVHLAPLRPGLVSLPPLAVAYRAPPREGRATPSTGAADTLRSGPIGVTVEPVLPDTAMTLRDIKDLAPLPGRASHPWWRLGATTAALLIAAATVVVLRARRSRQPAPTAAGLPPLDAYHAAMHRLDAIAAAQWPARGAVVRHYEEITDTVRAYLTRAHGVATEHRTTPELLRSLPPSLAAHGRREQCRALLEEADVVKFARVRPDASRAAAFLERARSLIAAWHETAATDATATEAMADALR
jgi:hypothetical protein